MNRIRKAKTALPLSRGQKEMNLFTKLCLFNEIDGDPIQSRNL